MGEPVAADWLDLREEADARARKPAWPTLAPVLEHYLASREGAVHVVDLGSGTGANLRWLAPRLAALVPDRGVQWTLVDHDAALLARARAGPMTTEPMTTETMTTETMTTETMIRRHVGPIGDLADLIDDRPTLVTMSALLDVLTASEIDAFVDAAARHGAAVYAALTIRPTLTVRPGSKDPVGALLSTAFHLHQTRDGQLGHQASEHLRDRLRAVGYTWVEAPTPWLLAPDQAALIARLLNERFAAAVEVDPALTGPGARWLAERSADLDAGLLHLRLDHVDIVAAPRDRP